MTSNDRILPSLEVVAGESQLRGQTRASGTGARTRDRDRRAVRRAGCEAGFRKQR